MTWSYKLTKCVYLDDKAVHAGFKKIMLVM